MSNVYETLPNELVVELEAHKLGCDACQFLLRTEQAVLYYTMQWSDQKIRNIGGCWLIRKSAHPLHCLISYLKVPGDYL
jgi:hypothetical protein